MLRRTGCYRIKIDAAFCEFSSEVAQLRNPILTGDSTVVAKKEQNRGATADQIAQTAAGAVGVEE